MKTPRPTFVIVNPSAGRGRSPDRIPAYRELLRRHLPGHREAVSSHPGEEMDLADRALAEGYEILVAVGGDGTWSNVANRILRSGRRDVSLGLLPAGTGNDFGRSVGVTLDAPEASVRAISEGLPVRIDVGRVRAAGGVVREDGRREGGREESERGEPGRKDEGRYFLNVLGLGFDLAVIEDARRIPILKGDALYRFSAIRQLFGFPGLPLSITDGETGTAESVDHLMLIVANARIFGGNFRIAPNASLHDGKLDAVSIRNVGWRERMRVFGMASKGTHAEASNVTIVQGPRFRIELDPPVPYEIDGEIFIARESVLEAESVPDALSVLVPGPT